MSSNEGGAEAPFHDPAKMIRQRTLAGRSQAWAAREAGISPAHLCNIERGKGNPSPEVLAALAKVLGCEVSDFERDTADV